jgi:hypothetical protein
MALPRRLVTVDVVEDRRLQHEEPTVDPRAITLRFLLELDHPSRVAEHQPAEAARRLRGGQRGGAPV